MKGSEVFFKLFVWHFLITVAVILLTSIIPISDQFKTALYTLELIVVLLLYFLSGYFLTRKKVEWICYFAIALVGIVFWTFCFIQSPDSTDYKSNADSGGWFFYEFYIQARSPLNFIRGDDYSMKLDMFEKFIFPVIFSFLQFLGGQYKLKKRYRRRTSG